MSSKIPSTQTPRTETSTLKTFWSEHKPLALGLIFSTVLIIALIIVVIFTTSGPDDGVAGDNSRDYDLSLEADKKALENFKITDYLPLVSPDPSYKISYELTKDAAGNYNLNLVLSAFSASARTPMLKRLLSEDFGSEDPLKYDIKLENYYNPFTPYSLDDLKADRLPENFTKGSLYSFGDSSYTVQTLVHTLYDGETNIYRYVLENGEPKTLPKLIFTYKDLPFLSETQVKSLNSLE